MILKEIIKSQNQSRKNKIIRLSGKNRKKQLRIVLSIILMIGTIGGCGDVNDKANISSENKDLDSIVVEECTTLTEEADNEIEADDNLINYVKAQTATEEFCLFEGTWEVTEYLDTAVEYHAGIDYEDEEYIRQVEEYIKKYKDKYLGKQLVIRKDTVEMFGPITELGYYVESAGWLFDSVRQPSTLGIEPPFVCADILLKDSDEYLYMIYDDNGRMVLDVAGKFFELEKQEGV